MIISSAGEGVRMWILSVITVTSLWRANGPYLLILKMYTLLHSNNFYLFSVYPTETVTYEYEEIHSMMFVVPLLVIGKFGSNTTEE